LHLLVAVFKQNNIFMARVFMKIKNVLLACALLGAVQSAHAIPNWVAGGLTAGTGVVGGLSVGGFAFGVCELKSWPLGIAMCAGGALGGWLGYMFFFQFTPSGRMKRAHAIVDRLATHRLANQNVADSDKVMAAVKKMYMGQWPLVLAFRDLFAACNDLDFALGLAQAAQQEDLSFKKEAEKLYVHIEKLKNTFSTIVVMIQEDPTYLKQLELCNEHEMRQKELAVAQSAAHAQWSQANAQYAQATAQLAPKRVDVHHYRGY
jgi:hypothetical protein